MIKYTNDWGSVAFESQIFAVIALEAAMEMEEIYAVTNARGKVIRPKENGKESLSFIEVEEKDQNIIDLRMYVVVYFGKSISEAVHKLGSVIRNRIREITGVEVREILMTVTGVKSRKTARRELEIRC